MEIYEFEEVYGYAFEVPSSEVCSVYEMSDVEKEKRKIENRKKSQHRAGNRIRRLVDSNHERWVDDGGHICTLSFLTLTFAENLSTIDVANKIFSKFVKRLNYKIFKSKRSELAYLAVIEFQKRGAVHYHCVMFNLPDKVIKEERKERLIANVWGHGFVDIKEITETRAVAYYLTNYLKKKYDDERYDGKKKYFASRNLQKPLFIRNMERILAIRKICVGTELLYEKTFKSELLGESIYQKLKLTPELKARIRDVLNVIR